LFFFSSLRTQHNSKDHAKGPSFFSLPKRYRTELKTI